MRVEASMEFVLMLKKINRFKITNVDIPEKLCFCIDENLQLEIIAKNCRQKVKIKIKKLKFC